MSPTPRTNTPTEPDLRRRAPALAVEDRRQMIVDAVVPLLAEYGPDLTSRQIAEAAGVAEGTIFRAFGDKETLLRAAAEQYFDEASVLTDLQAIDPNGELEDKLTRVMAVMHGRFQGALRAVAALGGARPADHEHDDDEAARLIDALFAVDAARLAMAPGRIMHAVRLLAFASSVPEIAQSEAPFTHEELSRLLVRGILRDPGQATAEEGTRR